MPKITDTRIRALKPNGQRYVEWLGDGLGVRVGPTGKKSFVYTYREGNRVRWITLGRYPATSSAEARSKHASAMEARQNGENPADTELQAKREAREAPTVDQLADYYLERYAKRRKKSWREDERLLRKEALPVLGSRKAREVRRRDIVDLIEDIAERGAPVTANRTLAVITKMFNFAVDRELVEATPAAGIKRIHREQSRQRVLTETEIARFWQQLPAARMTEPLRLALRVMLATGQRRGEVAGAKWAEFDLAAGWWTIPAERSKNSLAHRVPLSPMALELLGALKAITGDSAFLLPSPARRKAREAEEDAAGEPEEQPITGRAITRAVARNLGVLELEDFTPHDIRRSVASHMAGMGINRLVISKLLNHVETGITAVYDRHSYDAEKRQALDKWARRLDAIRTGREAEVVPLAG